MLLNLKLGELHEDIVFPLKDFLVQLEVLKVLTRHYKEPTQPLTVSFDDVCTERKETLLFNIRGHKSLHVNYTFNFILYF